MKKLQTVVSLTLAVIFLSACSLGSGGSDGGVFRSDDGGKSFLPENNAGNKQTIGGTNVLSIAANPQNGNELYVGSKANGIFKTKDAGGLWEKLKVADANPAKVYSIAINPQDPDKVYATAAIGNRGKIMKSEDWGETWKESYVEPSDGTLVLCIAIDPQNPDKIFAGTDQGQIIFSEDGGNTWRNIFWSESAAAVYKIAIDFFDDDVAYAIIYQSGVVRTTDGGNSFQELESVVGSYSGWQNLENPMSIATDPNRRGWLYVGTSNGLLRSKDKGNNFDIIKTLNQTEEYSILSIGINPENSDELIFSAAKTFYKSVDGGVNWLTVQLNSSRLIQVLQYNLQNPEVIFAGLN